MNCLALNTRRAARSLTRLYEEQLRPSGLTPAQFGLLTMLIEHPEEAQSELAANLDLDSNDALA